MKAATLDNRHLMDHVTMLNLMWKDEHFSYVGYEHCLFPSEVKIKILY